MTTVFLAAQAAGQGAGNMSFLIMILAVFAVTLRVDRGYVFPDAPSLAAQPQK